MKRSQIAAVLCAFAVMSASAQTAQTEGLRSYAKAKQVLDAGLAALGGVEALRSVRTVRRQSSGDWFGSGQGPRPEPFDAPTLREPHANGRNDAITFIDYSSQRWRDEIRESDATDFIIRLQASDGQSAFETITYRSEKPYFRKLADADL